MEVPMLEDEEVKKAYELYGLAFKITAEGNMQERFKALISYYKEVTGEEYTNPNAIILHLVDIYGPLYEKCGNPLPKRVSFFE